jgi:hypothetical protein
MKKLFTVALAAIALSWSGFYSSAQAQSGCIGVGGVNSVPIPGITCASEPNVNTFAATGVGIVPAASATDIACITGSATKVIRLQGIRINGTGTAITVPVLVTKHATANTGGTAATTTALPAPYAVDSSDGAATATTTAYTANPTITDATPGIIDVQELPLAATSTSTASNMNFDYYTRLFMEAPTLRGVAQQICVNLNATSPTASLNVSFRWTESPQ